MLLSFTPHSARAANAGAIQARYTVPLGSSVLRVSIPTQKLQLARSTVLSCQMANTTVFLAHYSHDTLHRFAREHCGTVYHLEFHVSGSFCITRRHFIMHVACPSPEQTIFSQLGTLRHNISSRENLATAILFGMVQRTKSHEYINMAVPPAAEPG